MLSEMDMEGIGTEEHVVVSCNNDATHITKGKRTKRRLRPLSPCAATTTATAVTSSCSSASAGEDYGSFSSTTFEGTDQEEEDMANCLILLAQGGGGGGGGEGDSHPHPNQQQQQQKQEAENHVEGGVGNKMTESATKSGFYIYECKTCNRTFPSFQALGGHRASHKKPKVMMTTTTTQEEKKSPPPPPAPALITTTCEEFEEAKQSSRSQMKISPNPYPNPNPPPVSLELGCGVNRGASFNKCSSKSSKIHECSICGSEFTSGQALGGHMRRHRATASTNNNNNTPPTIQTTFDAVVVDVNNKPRNVLELDLNLPAPEDDLRDSKFQFPTTQKSSMVLSPAPALVGCHY